MNATVATKTGYTFADLLAMEPTDHLYEILGGELVVFSAPDEKHAAAVIKVVRLLLRAEDAGFGQETGTSYVRQMAQMVKESGPVNWTYQHDYDEETHFRALEALRGLAQRRGPEKDQPWFLCVSYTHPHDPYVNLQEFWDRYEGRRIAMPEAPPAGWQPHVMDVWTNSYHGVDVVAPTPEDVYRSRRGYYASTSYFDDKLGGLVGELARLGLDRNTLVLVTSDHGDMCGERGMWFKRTVRERAARVPLVVAGLEVPAGQRVAQNVSLVDLFPTMLDVAGLEPAPGFSHVLDGHSLAPFLRGQSPAGWPDTVIVENFGEATIAPIRSLITGHFKFIYVHGQPDQLHNLTSDPLEWRNLAGDPAHADLARQMKARLLDGWDPAEADQLIRESQHRRAFLKEALFQGQFTTWDYQPCFDASRRYVRRSSNQQWDPHLGH